MSSGNTLQMDQHRAACAGFNQVDDPGDAGTFNLDTSFDVICEVRTATTSAETRVLPPSEHFPLGTKLMVVFAARSGGGTPAITISNADAENIDSSANSAAQLDAPGAHAEFTRLRIEDGSPGWRLTKSENLTLS